MVVLGSTGWMSVSCSPTPAGVNWHGTWGVNNRSALFTGTTNNAHKYVCQDYNSPCWWQCTTQYVSSTWMLVEKLFSQGAPIRAQPPHRECVHESVHDPNVSENSHCFDWWLIGRVIFDIMELLVDYVNLFYIFSCKFMDMRSLDLWHSCKSHKSYPSQNKHLFWLFCCHLYISAN